MPEFKIKHPQCVFVGADFSALEVRTAVFSSHDEKMKQAYEEGKDLYSLIASMAYEVPYESCLEFYPEGTELEIEGKKIICGKKEYTNKEGKARRQASKSLLIGSIYQRGTASIAEQIKKTKEEAQELLNNFYKNFPTITAWMDQKKKDCMRLGYSEDAFGRRRRLPDATLPRYEITSNGNVIDQFNPFLGCKDRINNSIIEKYQKKLENVKSRKEYEQIQAEAKAEKIIIHDNNPKIQQALRQSVNYPCQSLGADIVKQLMLNIDKDPILIDLGYRLLIQVHDEVIGECPEENGQKVADRLVELMLQTPRDMGIDVPMSADAYIVRNWYEDELTTSILSTIMDNGNLSKDELFELISKNHPELTPESIWGVINTGEQLKI